MRKYALLFLCGMIFLLVSCSKKKPSAPDEDLSSSSSARSFEKKILAGETWFIDSLQQGDSLFLKVPVEKNREYRVQWDDSAQGSGRYKGDIKVQVLDSARSDTYWWLSRHDGYDAVQELKAQESLIWVQIIAVRTGRFALRVVEKSVSGSSGGGGGVSAQSSAALPSSSGKLEFRLMTRTWLKDSINYGDTAEYWVKQESGSRVHYLDIMDFVRYRYAEALEYPSASVRVRMLNQSGAFLFETASTSEPIPILIKDSLIKIQVLGTDELENGVFFIRYFSPRSFFRKDLQLGIWMVDSAAVPADTLIYSLTVQPKRQYVFKWIWDFEATDLRVSIGDWGQDGKNLVADAELPQPPAANVKAFGDTIFIPSSDRVMIRVTRNARSVGVRPFRIQVIPLMRTEQWLEPSTRWKEDTLYTRNGRDTVFYVVPLQAQCSYRVQFQDAGFWIGSMPSFAAFLSVIGVLDSQDALYRASRSSWGDPLELKIPKGVNRRMLKILAYGSEGLFRVRILRASFTKLLGLDVWNIDTLFLGGETASYIWRVPETGLYELQIVDSRHRSGKYSLPVRTAWWLITEAGKKSLQPEEVITSTGELNVRVNVAAGDSVLLTVTGENDPPEDGGTFAVRVIQPMVRGTQELWTSHQITPGEIYYARDTVVYKVGLTRGEGYYIQFKPEFWFTDGMAQVSFDGTRSWKDLNRNSAMSYSAGVDTLYLRVFSRGSPGSYGVRVWRSCYRRTGSLDDWNAEHIRPEQDLDSFRISIPVIPGNYYLVRSVDSSTTFWMPLPTRISIAGEFSASDLDRNPRTVRAQGDSLIVVMQAGISGTEGLIGFWVQERHPVQRRELQGPDDPEFWRLDSLSYFGDTVEYSVSVRPGMYYRTTIDSGNNCALAMQFRTRSGGPWSESFFSSAGFAAEAERMWVRFFGQPEEACRGVFRFNLRAARYDRLLTVSPAWSEQRLWGGDTLYLRVPVEAGKTYRLQWDGKGQGSGMFSAQVKAWIQDGQSWKGVYQEGYFPVVKVRAFGDTLVARFCGVSVMERGTFAVRLMPWTSADIPLSVSRDWHRDSLNAADTITYRLGVQNGRSYRVQWYDADLDAQKWPADLVVWAENGLGNRYWISARDSGYVKHLVVPVGDSLILRVTGQNARTCGGFQIRVYPEDAMRDTVVITPDSVWRVYRLETVDTLLLQVPLSGDALFWYRVDDRRGGGAYGDLEVLVRQREIAGEWTNPAAGRYDTLRLLPVRDTAELMLYASAARDYGRFAVRVSPLSSRKLPLSLLSMTEAELQTGEVHVYEVQTGPGWTRVVWEDRDHAGSGYAGDVEVSVYGPDGILRQDKVDIGYLEFASPLLLFSAVQETLYIVVSRSRKSAAADGAYAIQAYAW